MGFIETEVESGIYYLKYTGTVLNNAFKIISVVTIMGVIGVYIRKVKYGQD